MQLISKHETSFYALCCIIIGFGLVSSAFLMSLGQILLLMIFLLTGDFQNKWRTLKQNTPFLLLISLFIIHLLGLTYTIDFESGVSDIKTKLPILIISLVLGSIASFSKELMILILRLFVIAVIVSSLVFIIYFQYQQSKGIVLDSRAIMNLVKISHIRYSYCIVMALVFCAYDWYENYTLSNYKIFTVNILTVIWLLFALIKLQSFNGFIALFLIVLGVAVKNAVQHKKLMIPMLLVFTFVGFLVFYAVNVEYKNFHIKQYVKKLPQKTMNGNAYTFTQNLFIEFNKYPFSYYCEDELRQQWAHKSNVNYEALNLHKTNIFPVLVRYLAFKNLSPDSLGVSKLTPYDIHLIEQGVSDDYTSHLNPFSKRIYFFIFEFINSEEIGYEGKSLILKAILWKTGFQMFINNFWTGAGTGSSKKLFKEKYSEETFLSTFKHCHNQYLTFGITLGIIGFVVGSSVLFLSYSYFKPLPIYIVCFLVLIHYAMFTEDMLNTQAGVTFYMYFNGLFLNHLALKKHATSKKT